MVYYYSSAFQIYHYPLVQQLQTTVRSGEETMDMRGRRRPQRIPPNRRRRRSSTVESRRKQTTTTTTASTATATATATSGLLGSTLLFSAAAAAAAVILLPLLSAIATGTTIATNMIMLSTISRSCYGHHHRHPFRSVVVSAGRRKSRSPYYYSPSVQAFTTTTTTTTATPFLLRKRIIRRNFFPCTITTAAAAAAIETLPSKLFVSSSSSSSSSSLPPQTTRTIIHRQHYHRRYWTTSRLLFHDDRSQLITISSRSRTRLFSSTADDNNGDVGDRKESSSSSSSSKTTKKTKKKSNNYQWDVGDYVSVPLEGPGIITEKRGSGWFSIELLTIDEANDANASNAMIDGSSRKRGVVVKCRGNRLEPFDGKQQRQQESTENDGNGGGEDSIDDLIIATSTKSSTGTTTTTKTKTNTSTIQMLVDPGIGPDVAPPPPTIHNLDALIEQVLDDPPTGSSRYSLNHERAFVQQLIHHSSFDKWVVFTDLHCSTATLNTCLEVLELVHTAAVQRGAGVLFLGDFWHHRGTLRVDCLNKVLDAFKSWTVPLVMIPGNHDQVTLGGHSHGLTPLENAFRVNVGSPSSSTLYSSIAKTLTWENDNDVFGDDTTVAGPLVLSHPTVFRQALLVPHVRDMSVMESVLQSPQAKNVTALLVHAEVKGALMNDLIVSTHGIPPASFPPHKRIYSGHFHKPHFVKAADDRVSIEYLGSPYQVSMAEAQQDKHLAVLDAARGWECVERIPLDVGKKHFRASSIDELLQFGTGEKNGERHSSNGHVNVGDRIVLTIPKEQRLLHYNVDKARDDDSNENVTKIFNHIQSLRDQGVMVEVRETEQASDSTDTMQSSSKLDGSDSLIEDLTPESVWRNYVREEINETADPEYYESILQAGLEIISEIQSSGDAQEVQAFWGTGGENLARELTLSKITIQGFGPFRQQVTYPLSNRGLVLLRGANNDVGADSNGSGKTSLAVATLWALTGSLDARKAQDGKVADVVNDDSKTARVTLEGYLNDYPFVLSRTKTATKGELLFNFDGQDLTTQSVKETQALVEETLGVDANLLSRTMFHGQHGMNDLLEATDAKLKEELALIVPLDMWQLAATTARAKTRQARKKGDEINGMIQLRKEDVRQASDRLRRSEALQQEKNERYAEAKKRATEELNKIDTLLKSTIDQDVSELQDELNGVLNTIEEFNGRLQSLVQEQNEALSPLEIQWREAKEALEISQRNLFKAQQSISASQLQVDTARSTINALEQKWSVDLSRGTFPEVIIPPQFCPTCQQPILDEDGKDSHQSIEITMSNEIEEALDRLSKAEQHNRAASDEVLVAERSLQTCEESENEKRQEFEKLSLQWASILAEWEEKIASEKRRQNQLTAEMSKLLEQTRLSSRRDAVIAELKMEQSAKDYADETSAQLAQQVSEAEGLLEKLDVEKQEYAASASAMSDLGERFGQRGVQTYVLKNAVDSLESLAQTYLDQMTDGGIRLELSLEAGDKIIRRAFVVGSDGQFRERPLSTLSGGQWRRCSLALTFGFAELVARRGRLRSSICVLDEPLTHLDRSGRDKFGAVVRGMIRQNQATGFDNKAASNSPSADQNRVSGYGMSTIIMILQDLAAEELEEAFDCIDTVVRENGQSSVLVDSE